MDLGIVAKNVVLANGSRVRLDAAAVVLGLLAAYLANPDIGQDAIYHLREVCLGRPVEPDQARTLVREQLLRPDGGVDPAVQAVVLSAVRGEGRNLRVESPFTDPLDRAVAELLNARDYVRVYLGEGVAQAILDPSPIDPGHDPLHRSGRWTNRESDRTDSPDAPGITPR